MRVPSVKRILTETFPDVKWIGALLEPINRFFEEVARGLNKQLTITENMDGIVKKLRIDGTYPVTFKWERAALPTVALIGKVARTNGGDVVTHLYDDTGTVERRSAVSLDWDFTSDGYVRVKEVLGLAASNSTPYEVTIIVLAESI
jgi:hypothetical protein